MRLAGKSALVFGGTSGIGKASAEIFAREGASVTIVGRNGAGEEISQHIIKSGGVATFVRADVTNVQDIISAIDGHIERFGTIDVLFNNASKESNGDLIVDTTEEEFDQLVATNLKSVFMSCKHAVPHMARAGRGAIINTTAASAREGLAWPGLGAYIATKGAVIAFTRVLAVELSPLGIRANSLNPGIVNTPMLQRFCEAQQDPVSFQKNLNGKQLLGRVGLPSELANAALFLASDESSFVTGTDLLVDGGLVLG